MSTGAEQVTQERVFSPVDRDRFNLRLPRKEESDA
jgi:hypothetical protein